MDIRKFGDVFPDIKIISRQDNEVLMPTTMPVQNS